MKLSLLAIIIIIVIATYSYYFYYWLLSLAFLLLHTVNILIETLVLTQKKVSLKAIFP